MKYLLSFAALASCLALHAGEGIYDRPRYDFSRTVAEVIKANEKALRAEVEKLKQEKATLEKELAALKADKNHSSPGKRRKA